MVRDAETNAKTTNNVRKTTTSNKNKNTRSKNTRETFKTNTEDNNQEEKKTTPKTQTKSTGKTQKRKSPSSTKSKNTKSSNTRTRKSPKVKESPKKSSSTKKSTNTSIKKSTGRKTTKKPSSTSRSIPKDRRRVSSKNKEVENKDIHEEKFIDNIPETEEKSNYETIKSYNDSEVYENHENIIFFDENNIDKAIEFVDFINVAFLHPFSAIIDYREGNTLIVQDILKNRHKLKLESSKNPLIDPKVSAFYVMRPAKFKKGDVFDSKLIALFSNEDIAHDFLNSIVEAHNKKDNDKKNVIENNNEKVVDENKNNLLEIHNNYLNNNSLLKTIIKWCKNNKIVTICAIIIFFNVIVFAFNLTYLFSSHENVIQSHKIGKTYVNLSPTEEKIRADNMIISEINRIQNNEPSIGPVGQNIRSRGLNAEQISLLKKNVQEEVSKLIEIQGKINSGMGSQTGGHNIPFSSQTDRFGISNVPPEDSWSTTTGARMSIPSGSNGVASQKDLAEFGIIN